MKNVIISLLALFGVCETLSAQKVLEVHHKNGEITYSINISDIECITVKTLDETPTEPVIPDEVGEDTNAQNEIDAKDSRRGSVSTSFKGNGTSSSPYLISSAADLRLLSDEVRTGNDFDGKYLKMTADIVINRNVLNSNGEPNDSKSFERWIPIGSSDNLSEGGLFCGTFDGNGHSVSGIYINRPGNMSRNGLFGVVDGGTIKNITLKDSYISGGDQAGGIVGYALDYNNGNVTITNCHNYARVNSIGGAAGGVVGQTYNEDGEGITQCSNYGAVSSVSEGEAEAGNAGGICGSSRKDSTTDCLNFGDVSGRISGGINANIANGYTIRNCANYGNIHATFRAGGISGIGKGTISNCVNIGEITADTEDNVGAIAGGSLSASSYNHYLTSSCSNAFGISGGTQKDNNPCSVSEMKGSDVLNALNKHKQSGDDKWVPGTDGYPILEWGK